MATTKKVAYKEPSSYIPESLQKKYKVGKYATKDMLENPTKKKNTTKKSK